MPYKPNDIPETASILGIAFVVGVIAQYLRQKTDINPTTNVLWRSIASGFSAMVIVGLLYEYTPISGAFLVAISGLAGWAGFTMMSTLSKALDQFLIKGAEKKLDIVIEKPTTGTPKKEEEDSDNTNGTTAINSQSE